LQIFQSDFIQRKKLTKEADCQEEPLCGGIFFPEYDVSMFLGKVGKFLSGYTVTSLKLVYYNSVSVFAAIHSAFMNVIY
jgi:hypothetical protein